MSCKHHPKYDPTSGEPTGGYKYAHQTKKYEGVVEWIPCPYCWQARAEWLDVKLAEVTEDVKGGEYDAGCFRADLWEAKKRIKKLEADKGTRLADEISELERLRQAIVKAKEKL